MIRDIEPLPAWAARQRNRRIERHGDQKVIRWISYPAARDQMALTPAQAAGANGAEATITDTSPDRAS